MMYLSKQCMIHSGQITHLLKINTCHQFRTVRRLARRVKMKKQFIRVDIIYDMEITGSDIRVCKIYLCKAFEEQIWILAIEIAFSFVCHIRIDIEVVRIFYISLCHEAILIKLIFLLIPYSFLCAFYIIECDPLIFVPGTREAILTGASELCLAYDIDSATCDLVLTGSGVHIDRSISELIYLC